MPRDCVAALIQLQNTVLVQSSMHFTYGVHTIAPSSGSELISVAFAVTRFSDKGLIVLFIFSTELGVSSFHYLF